MKPRRYCLMWMPVDSDTLVSQCFDDIDEAREFASSFEHHGIQLLERVNIRRDPEWPELWDYDEVEI